MPNGTPNSTAVDVYTLNERTANDIIINSNNMGTIVWLVCTSCDELWCV